MNQIVVGHFEPDGSLIYLPIGFKPDYFELCEAGATAPLLHRWWGRMEQDGPSAAMDGIQDDADGTLSPMATGEGFAAYGAEQATPIIYAWSASGTTMTERDGAGTTTIAARTAGAHGTYICPTTDSDTEREAIFECVTASGNTAATEPAWPAEIGGKVADTNNVWERVNVAEGRGGYDGIRISADLMTNSEECYYLAIQADNVIDHGDVAGWTGGIYGS